VSLFAGKTMRMIPQSQAQHAVVGINRCLATRASKKNDGSLRFFKAGLPLLLFSGLGVWVVSNGIAGKNKERDAFQGRISVSERQAMMQKEHDDVMEKITKIVETPFDNTKRIERPEEVLARRREEREHRNAWYRRLGRWIVGSGGD